MFIQAPEGAIISVHVVPNSRQFSIVGEGSWAGTLKVRVVSQADKGKANKELCSELGKLFQSEVRILSGEKSSRKRLLVVGKTVEEAEKKLRIR